MSRVVLPCELALSSHGLLIGWRDELGAAWARLDSLRALRPEHSLHLGVQTTDAEPGAVAWSGRRPLVLASGEPSVLHAQGEDIELPPCLQVATAPGWAAGAGDGIWLHGHGRTRFVSEVGDATDLEVVALQRGAMVLYTTKSSELGVLHVVGDEVSEVRHRLDRPAISVDAQRVGGRTAVVIGDEKGIEAALVDAQGRMRERPHQVLRGTAGLVRVVWRETHFAVAAADGGVLRVHRLSDDQEIARFEGVTGPFALGHQGRRLVVAQVHADNATVELSLRIAVPATGEGHTLQVDVTPSTAESRRRRHQVRRMLVGVAGSFRTADGYRDASPRGGDADGLGVEVELEGRRASLRTEVGQGVALSLTLAFHGVEAPPPSRSLGRLARWMRRRWGRGDQPEWLAPLIGDRTVESYEQGPGWLRLTLDLVAVPPAPEVARWIDALSERVPAPDASSHP